MKIIKSNKSQSNLIATVLLILIAIVIVLFISGFSFGYLNNKKAESEGFSFHYNAEVAEVYKGELFNSPPVNQPQKIEILVRRIDTGEDVRGVRFVFEDNIGNEYSYDNETYTLNSSGMTYSYLIGEDDVGMDFNSLKRVSIRILYEGGVTEILDEREI